MAEQPSKQATEHPTEKPAEPTAECGSSGLPDEYFIRKPSCDPCVECRKIKMEELLQHSDPEAPWIAVKGYVYDVTHFLEKHPGGPTILLENSGRDVTTIFEDVGHSNDAKELMKGYKIGRLVD